MQDLYFALLEYAFIHNLTYSQILGSLKQGSVLPELIIPQNFLQD